MLTIDALRSLGVDVEDGLRRCMNMEAFYLQMVEKGLRGMKTEELKAALAEGDLQKAFEAAHAMKGVLANLSLTPALAPANELTELLRARTACDYAPLVARLETELAKIRAMMES